MGRCVTVRVKKRKYCIGDLDTEIQLSARNITAPAFNTVNFNEEFTPEPTLTWAGIETVTGKTFFDGVSTETPITHHFIIAFDSTVTSETWVIFGGRRLDILQVEDIDERHEYLRLVCTDLGLTAKAASKS